MWNTIHALLWLSVLVGPILAVRKGTGAQRLLASVPIALVIAGTLLSVVPLLGWAPKWVGLGLGSLTSLRLAHAILASKPEG